MMRALWSAASGMKTQQAHMDVISNNIANVNTTGMKKQRAEFQDLLYQTLRPGGAENGADSRYPEGLQIGLGARLSATSRIFTEGNLQASGNPLDVAIEGEGFFQVELPDGTTGYTRDGGFKLDANRRLVTTDGYQLTDGIVFDENAPLDSITIAGDGTVSNTPAGGTTTEVGRITLARFVNPAGLTAIGKNLFKESDASGAPIESQPGTEGAGTLVQSVLEMSNVQIVEEMVNMIVAQRAYESDAKAITTSDSMLEIANGLKR